jgi:Immunity protein 10
MTVLEATAAAVTRDDYCEVLYIAEDRNSTDGLLEVQRAFEFDQQDRDLGQDTYCLVVDTGPVHYGGVERWTAIDGGVRMQLSAPAAEALGLERDLEIRLPDPEHHALVVDALARLLVD